MLCPGLFILTVSIQHAYREPSQDTQAKPANGSIHGVQMALKLEKEKKQNPFIS